MEPGTIKNLNVSRPNAKVLAPVKMRIVRLEDQEMLKVPLAPRRYFFHLIFVRNGTGWSKIDFKNHEFKPNKVFAIKPGQVRGISIDSGTTGYLLEFDRDFVRSEYIMEEHFLRNLDYVEDIIDLPAEKQEQVFFYLGEMYKEVVSNLPKSETMIYYIFKVLIIFLTRDGVLRKKLALEQLGFLDKFHALVENNFSIHHSVEFYSDQLKINAKALTTKIKNTTGQPARYFIHQRCILESKRLLAYTELSVKEITHQLGFEDPNYFSRFFTRLEGVSPQTFRKKHRSFN